MKLFKNLKIRLKFLVVGLVVLPFLVGLGGVGIWGVNEINILLQHTQQSQLPDAINLGTAISTLNAARVQHRQANMEPILEKRLAALAQADALISQLRKIWDAYVARPHSPEEVALAQPFEFEWNAYMEQLEAGPRKYPPLGNSLENQQKYLDVVANGGHDKKLIAILQSIIDYNQQESATSAKQAQQTFGTVVMILIITTVAVVVLTACAALLISRTIIKSLAHLGEATKAIAGGDLTQQVELNTQDELGELGQTFNITLHSLRKLIFQLYSQSQQVNSATEELIAQARSQVAGSSQQVGAIAEATQSLQELNQTAEEIARQVFKVTEAVTHSLEQAQEVNELADRMVVSHEEGRTTVAGTISGLQNLKDQIANIEEQQQAVVVQAGAIRGIVELIDSIAKETHLLALNASIEAAGAGTYGERFAVIAGEVKRLADRSFGATKEVQAALGGIAEAVSKVSGSAQTSLKEAEKAVQDAAASDQVLLEMATLTRQVKEAVQEIVVQVKDTATLASSIGIATKQQQSSSHQMLEKMLEIETVTAQNLNSVKQGESVTYQLNASAQLLEQSADAFKLVA